jgi:tetrapyrrole methylase family protein/MazG family protein
MIDDLICPEIAKQCQDAGLSVRIIGSMSLVEHTIALLNVGFLPQLIITNASKLLNRYTPGFSPSTPVLITQISTLQTARNLKKLFTPIYHDDHPVILVVEVGTIHENIVELTIDELDTLPSFKSQATLFIPPISTTASFEAFQEVIARLRAPDGCPWDRAQTHTSLKPFLLEEAYETLDALDREDISDLQEELGDLMLQILLHAQIASEEGNFNIHDVLEGIATKLIRRHPHVFAEVDVADVSGVIRNWEAIKAEERLENSDFGKKGLLDGVPIALPALLQAQEIVERLRRVGFDLWTEIDFVNQIHEMTKMFNQEDQGGKDKIMGEMLILLTSAAQLQGIDAESVLRQSLTNFRQRFSVLESHILESGRTLADITVDEKKKLWSTLIDDGGHTE